MTNSIDRKRLIKLVRMVRLHRNQRALQLLRKELIGAVVTQPGWSVDLYKAPRVHVIVDIALTHVVLFSSGSLPAPLRGPNSNTTLLWLLYAIEQKYDNEIVAWPNIKDAR